MEGDARVFDLREHFRLIFLTGNAFQAFVTNAEQAAVLQRVHAHLDAEGLFAFETRNPLFPNFMTREGYFVTLETLGDELRRPSYINVNGYEVHITTTQVYDHVAQLVHVTATNCWHDGEQEHTQVTRTALRYTFPQELAALLYYNGFTILRQYGDWNEEPLTAASPSIVSVCPQAHLAERQAFSGAPLRRLPRSGRPSTLGDMTMTRN